MPIYEYRCNNCGEDFEIFSQTSGETEKPCCPACGKNDTKKLISQLGYLKHPDQSSKPSTSSLPEIKSDK